MRSDFRIGLLARSSFRLRFLCTAGEKPAASVSITLNGLSSRLPIPQSRPIALAWLFAVRGYTPPSGHSRNTDSTSSIALQAGIPACSTDALGEAAESRGNEEDGQVWKRQELAYSLGASPPGHRGATRNHCRPERGLPGCRPLKYRVDVIAGPGKGCAAA
jgi:hypothetical protein